MADQSGPSRVPPRRTVVTTGTTLLAGCGWRAEGGDPQGITVDLQADCEVTDIRLTFEADASDPVYAPDRGSRLSHSLVFSVETSEDHTSWTTAYRTTTGTGGVVNIQLPSPRRARWVRLTSRKRSSPLPLGVEAFEVYGTRDPAHTCWTEWASRPLSENPDWRLLMLDWVDTEGATLSSVSVDTRDWLPVTR